MINSVFLLGAAVLVFVLGYRFYAKFLALAVFRLDPAARTPAQAGVPDAAPCPRHQLLGHHLAAVAAGTTLAGSAVALVWGWVPAFLWVVMGSVVAAGTYGLAGLWLGVRHGAASPATQAARLLGARLRPPFFALVFILLLLLTALFALGAAQLLDGFPSAVFAFGLQIVLALALGSGLTQRLGLGLLPASAIALALIGLALWLLPSLAMDGTLVFSLSGMKLLSIDGVTVWVVVLLVYSYYSARAPLARLARPYGYLSAVQLGLALLVLFAGVLWLHPPLAAPAFHVGTGAPALLPWLFLTLTSGALAGFHALVASGITARQVQHETDVRFIGYGGALGDGLLALGVIIACSAGFPDAQAWHQVYGSWEGVQNLSAMTAFFIERFGYFAGGLGIAPGLAHAFGALLAVNLCVTTLEAGIRLQKYLLSEMGEAYDAPRLRPEKPRLLLATGMAAVLALYDGHGRALSPLDGWWPLFGLMNQLLAAAVLVLAVLALKRLARPLALVVAPLLMVLALTLWGLLAQLAAWWSHQHWGIVLGGLALLVTLLWILLEGLLALARTAQNTPGT